MPEGIIAIVEDGLATITPEPAQRGKALTALLEVTSDIQTDTSGSVRSYVVLEDDARKAGLLDDAEEPAEKPDITEAVKETAAKTKTAARKAPAKSTAKADTKTEGDWV